jgi:hypothetical protein
MIGEFDERINRSNSKILPRFAFIQTPFEFEFSSLIKSLDYLEG